LTHIHTYTHTDTHTPHHTHHTYTHKHTQTLHSTHVLSSIYTLPHHPNTGMCIHKCMRHADIYTHLLSLFFIHTHTDTHTHTNTHTHTHTLTLTPLTALCTTHSRYTS